MEISYYKFPNKMFLHSEDVIPLIWKLDRLCYNDTFYGPKRPLLDAQYPKLCPLFDLIDLAGIDPATGNIYQGLGLNDTALVAFKQELMTYASENLIKINAFLDSPYLSKFETDEVIVLSSNNGHCRYQHVLPPQVMSPATFIANIGGMLGLCMGFSFVSLVEIFFFASKLLGVMIQKKK